MPAEYTSYFRSVIVFGRRCAASLDEGAKARRHRAARAAKYAPEDSAEGRRAAIDREWKPLCMLEMTPEHISGKEAIERCAHKRKRQALIIEKGG